MFRNVKIDKEKAIARFNRFGRIVKLWKIFQVLVVFGLISWSSARVPAVLEIIGGYFFQFSTYLFNHLVVFLIGNAIIVLLFMLCRQNDVNITDAGEFYDDYMKYSEAVRLGEPTMQLMENAPAVESGGVDVKQIVVRAEATKAIPPCDDVVAAIEKATRQIKWFQKIQSEKLKREIAVRPQSELRRSETENCRKTVSTASLDVAEMETLSNEEFRRRVDAFIDKHWGKRTTKFGEYENYQLVKMP